MYDVTTWLKSQVINAKMTGKKAHIAVLLKWAREVTDSDARTSTLPKDRRKIAVCFCGPTPLAATLEKAAAKIGGTMEYSAHSQ